MLSWHCRLANIIALLAMVCLGLLLSPAFFRSAGSFPSTFSRYWNTIGPYWNKIVGANAILIPGYETLESYVQEVVIRETANLRQHLYTHPGGATSHTFAGMGHRPSWSQVSNPGRHHSTIGSAHPSHSCEAGIGQERGSAPGDSSPKTPLLAPCRTGIHGCRWATTRR